MPHFSLTDEETQLSIERRTNLALYTCSSITLLKLLQNEIYLLCVKSDVSQKLK